MNSRFYRNAAMLLVTTMLSVPVWAAPAPHPPVAGHDVGIVAVVGSDAISSYDLDNRIRFIIASAHLSNTPDVIDRIRPQVIRTLIDEKLQLQEANKNDIKVSDADIAQAVAAIEEQRGMPKGTIYHLLDDNHIPREVFTQQLHAQLAWSQLLSKKIRPQVHISDEEITMASRNYVPPAPKRAAPEQGAIAQELKISVITLPVDKPSRLQEIKRLGDKLVSEVRGGANFEEVSRHFSSVVADGGKAEAFWIKLSQLEPNIARILATVPAGTVTDPLRSSEGFTIIKVYDVHTAPKKGAAPEKPIEKPEEPKAKDVEVKMKEILLKIKPDASNKEADMMLQVGEEVAKAPGTCDEKGVASIKDLENFDIDVNYRTSMLADLPPAVKIIASTLKVGEISTPFASNEGIRLYMLCSKKEADGKSPDRDEVFHMLLTQKMELEAQKYMRNLRRETFIDIR